MYSLANTEIEKGDQGESFRSDKKYRNEISECNVKKIGALNVEKEGKNV